MSHCFKDHSINSIKLAHTQLKINLIKYKLINIHYLLSRDVSLTPVAVGGATPPNKEGVSSLSVGVAVGWVNLLFLS